MTQPVLADYRVPTPEQWHTFVMPLGLTEDPPARVVAEAMASAFGDLPFAEVRLPSVEWNIEEDKDAAGKVTVRRLVGRFPRWATDPAPCMDNFKKMSAEEYRKAQLSKGKV